MSDTVMLFKVCGLCMFLCFDLSSEVIRVSVIPREVLRISSGGDDRMRVKIKTPKNPWSFQHNSKKSLDQTLTLKNPMPNFRPLKISRKN